MNYENSYLIRYETSTVGGDARMCQQIVIKNAPSFGSVQIMFWALMSQVYTELIGVQKIYHDVDVRSINYRQIV